MWNEYLRSRSPSSNIPWQWIWILLGVVLLIFIARYFSNWSSTVDSQRPHLLISPDTSLSNVIIAMTESSKNRITGTGGQPLYVGDKSVSVETGWAHATNDGISIHMDERTELIYMNHSGNTDTYNLAKWRVWVEQSSDTNTFMMKNLSVTLKSSDIVMLEQNTQIYSTVYALRWNILISTSIWDYTLKAGNRIMISSSDLANPWLQLMSLVGDIDESITDTPIFVKNNGKSLLSILRKGTESTWAMISSWSDSMTSLSAISILDPIDWSIANKALISIHWTINSKDIKRVTINDQDTTVSPVNNTFVFLDFPITAETNNIVYKVYNNDGKQVEKWVITIYGSKQAMQSANKLISNNSPISSKDFQITNPSSNPFVTMDRLIKVQWLVPKDTVSYIMVNDYRLQKFIAWGTNWLYYANIDNDTMRDGINLYTIKFYGPKNDVLYTQLFTIIKESKNATISGESSR